MHPSLDLNLRLDPIDYKLDSMDTFGALLWPRRDHVKERGPRHRGSALAWVLAGSAVLGIISFALLTRLDTLQKQSAKSNTKETIDSTLSAVTDAMLFMVQQRWCVSDNANRINTSCNLGNPRSLERLLVSNSALTQTGAA